MISVVIVIIITIVVVVIIIIVMAIVIVVVVVVMITNIVPPLAVELPLPVAVYHLDGVSGGRDVGPNKFPAAKHDDVFPATGPNNRINGSFALQGDFIEIPNNGNLDTRQSTSILLWMYHEGQTGPIVHYGLYRYPLTLRMWLNRAGGVRVEFVERSKESGVAMAMTLTTQPIAPRTWHHVATVHDYSTGTASVWLNGTLVVVYNIGRKELATDTRVVRMGALAGDNDRFIGRVSCLQFYKVSLTEEQITELMTKCRAGPGNALQARSL